MCGILSLSYAVDLAVKGSLHIVGEQIYGYVIVEDALGIAAWMFAILILTRERLLVLKGKSHGIAITLFWIINVLWFGLQIVSINSPKWWWKLSTRADISDLTLFVIRALLLTGFVLLGILRPVCCRPKTQGYSLLVNVEPGDQSEVEGEEDEGTDTEQQNKENRERKEGSFIRKRTTSAFSDFWTKAKLLFPYVWPKRCVVSNLVYMSHNTQ